MVIHRNHKQYTPGEVAVLLDVAAATVVKWCNQGLLESHKLPGRGDRRIMPESLVAFCQNQNIPLPAILKNHVRTHRDDPKWLTKLLKATDAKGFHCSATEAFQIANAYREKDLRVTQLSQLIRDLLDGQNVRDLAEELLAKTPKL